MSTTQVKPNLCETTTFGIAPKVDEENGILEGVKILGEHSKNGRRYTPEAMRNAIGLYEGVKSYTNHPKRSELSEDRNLNDWLGVFEGVHYREGKGLFGNFRLRKEGPHFKGVIEAARDFPQHAGFSHVADGKSVRKGDTEIVESIREVFSVDLVTDPATTKGFFESVQQGPRTVKTSLKNLVEGLPETVSGRKLLLEAIEAKSLDGATEIEHDDNADDASKLLLATEAFTKATVKTVTPPPADDDVKAQLAELKAENARISAKAMLLESGREATDIRVKALASAPEADRKDLLESWPVKAAQPASRRPGSSPPLNESVEQETEVKAVEDRLQESLKRARARQTA